MLRDFYCLALSEHFRMKCSAMRDASVETSHVTALLLHEEDVNRKVADSSKINNARLQAS